MHATQRLTRLVRKRARGQSIPLIAMMLVILVAMVGLSVDVGNTFAEDRKVVAASNAASLAGMDAYIKAGGPNGIADNATVRNAIEQSLQVNGVDLGDDGGEVQLEARYRDRNGSCIGDADCTVQISNTGKAPTGVGYIEVKLNGKVDTYFARVVGRDDLPVDAKSYASYCPADTSVYPIAVNAGTIDGDRFVAANDSIEHGVYDEKEFRNATWQRLYQTTGGSSNNDFGWVRWSASGTGQSDLAISLTGDGNVALGFEEVPTWPDTNRPNPGNYPEQPNQFNPGDWLWGVRGDQNNSAVANALTVLKNNKTRMILPVYDDVSGEDSEAKYRVAELGIFAVRDFGTDARGKWVELIYVGNDTSDQSKACTAVDVSGASGTMDLEGPVSLLPEYQDAPETNLPVQYVVVLDVSGSMNANFQGQGTKGGSTYQCANGPAGAPPSQNCGNPNYSWMPQSERRIFVAKKAIQQLITLTNMPGNSGYNPNQPADEMYLVWFNDSVPTSNSSGQWSDNTNFLSNKVRDAGKANNDPYKTSGGTNGAAGLYRAYQALESKPAEKQFQGETWKYKRVVIFITDGVSNKFLDTNRGDLNGGSSDAGTYASGHECGNLGNAVTETAPCQTTEVGGKRSNGMDRPITQMVNVSKDLIQNNSRVDAEVYVIGLSNIPDTGLKSGVASFPSYFYEVQTLTVDNNGDTSVDRAMRDINQKTEVPTCLPKADADLVTSAGSGFVEGKAYLHDQTTGQTQMSPIREESGRLWYSFRNVPEGTYTVDAYVTYTHPEDGVTRTYSLIQDGDETKSSVPITISPQADNRDFSGKIQLPIELRLSGDVCAATGP